MAVAISSLSFEHHTNAFGIAEPAPRISWRFEGAAVDWEQKGYDLEITRDADGVPRLFNVNSTESVLVPWPDTPLSSSESAKVRVRAYGADGQASTEWSDASSVEIGLLETADWAGALAIAADRETEVDADKRPVLFRKEFGLDSTIASARLYVTALGVYVAELNGQRVGDHVLAPGPSSYNNRHPYDTYDVTSLLRKGENALGVTVGEGWWSGRANFVPDRRNVYGDTIGLLGVLQITSADGTTQNVATDLSWKASAEGPIITSSLYNGEVYDSRLEIKGWSETGYNDNDWLAVKELPAPKGHLTSPDGPPVRIIETLKPTDVFKSPSGKTLVDFGQNHVGWLRLRVTGPAGTNITIRHAEVLEEGELGTRPLRDAKATDTFILSGQGEQTLEPHFTFHGFRYIEVTGWPNGTALDGDHLEALVVHSDLERTGHFECSNALLNKFHRNVLWSMKGNFLGIPTDCPQRDERLGWTGDAHAFMPTSNFLYDASGFWRSWLRDVWSETEANNNTVPDFVPQDPEFPVKPTAIWGDVIVANPWALFLATGDVQMLEEQFPGAQAWIDHGISRNEAGLWNRSTFQYADWLDPLAPSDAPGNATTAKHLVADSYLIQMTRTLANISAALGKTQEAERYTSEVGQLISAYHDAWIEPYDLIANVTQTALTLGIRFDLFDEETRTRAAETLNQLVANNSYLVGTGFAATSQIGFALSSVDSTAAFYKMLLQTKVPSWLYQVVMGGTTTWERWDSMLPNGTINPGEMTSFNHYAFGSVADWIHQKIGGLAPGAPGWKTIKIAPEPGGGITRAEASYLSPYGWANSTWTVNDEGLTLDVVIPPNAKAEVLLPGETDSVQIGSGFHHFMVEGYVLPE